MVNGSINDTITDSLSNNELGILNTSIEVQLGAHVSQRDPGVGQVDLPQSGLDHIVSESLDERVTTIPSKNAVYLIVHCGSYFESFLPRIK